MSSIGSTPALKASLVMQAAMTSMRGGSAPEPKKLHPSPFALPPQVLEEMRKDAGLAGESNASNLAGYLARGHQNYNAPAPKKKGTQPSAATSNDALTLELSIKERSLRALIDSGRLAMACAYCGVDGSLQLQLVKAHLQRRMFVEAGRCLTTFLTRYHEEEALITVVDAGTGEEGNDEKGVVSAPAAGGAKELIPSSALSGFLGAGQLAPSLPFGADAERLAASSSSSSSSATALGAAGTGTRARRKAVRPDYRLGGQVSLLDIQRFAQESSKTTTGFFNGVGGGADSSSSGPSAGVVSSPSATGSSSSYPGSSIQPSWSLPLAFAPADAAAASRVPFYDEKASVLTNAYTAGEVVVGARGKTVYPVTGVTSLATMRRVMEEEARCWAADAGELDRRRRDSVAPLPLFVVGVDAEWRPDAHHHHSASGAGSSASSMPQHSKGGAGAWPAALLQIATPFSVFLVDLLALHAEATAASSSSSASTARGVAEALDATVGELFRSASIPKLGFNLKGDIRKLTYTHPLFAKAFATCNCVVEVGAALQAVADEWDDHNYCRRRPEATSMQPVLSNTHPHSSAAEPLPPAILEKAAHTAKQDHALAPLWLLHLAPASSSSASAGGSRHHGHHHHNHSFHSLSVVAEQVLGFSLNKKQQTSDWQARPFTVEQVVYAALDALVLVEIVREALAPLVSIAGASSDGNGGSEALAALLMSVAHTITAEPHVSSESTLNYAVTLRGTAAIAGAAVTTAAGATSLLELPASTEPKSALPASIPTEEDTGSLLGPSDVRDFLLSQPQRSGVDDVDFMLMPAPPSTTAEGGADVLGIPPNLVVKTLSMFATVTHTPHNAGKTTSTKGGKKGNDGFQAQSQAQTVAIAPQTAPIIALVRGDCKVDYKKIQLAVLKAGVGITSRAEEEGAAAASTSKGGQYHCKVRMATLEECKEVFGFVPGSFPPCGHRATFPTFIDAGIPSILTNNPPVSSPGALPSSTPSLHHPITGEGLVFGGGGSLTMKMRMTWEQLLRYCLVGGGAVADIVSASSVPPPAATTGGLDAAAADFSAGLGDGFFSPAVSSPAAEPETGAEKPRDATIVSLEELTVPYDMPSLAFIIDGMLGRLCRWCRVIGVDAESTVGPGALEYLASVNKAQGKDDSAGNIEASASSSSSGSDDDSNEECSDGAAASGTCKPPKGVFKALFATRVMSIPEMIAWSRDTGKILVTRDRKVAASKMPPCPIYWVRAMDTQEAFEELTEHFSITVSPENLMSRCAKCNSYGYDRVDAAEAERLDPSIPKKVIDRVTDFWKCRGKGCGRLYWEGAKFADTRDAFLSLFEGSVIKPASAASPGES